MTRVLLTDAEKYPKHAPRRNKNAPISKANNLWERWRGTWVVIGKPKKPVGWSCDTDIVWPVLNAECFDRPPTDSDEIAYVCRHQIQAGD